MNPYISQYRYDLYLLRHAITKDVYIGISSSVERRVKTHQRKGGEEWQLIERRDVQLPFYEAAKLEMYLHDIGADTLHALPTPDKWYLIFNWPDTRAQAEARLARTGQPQIPGEYLPRPPRNIRKPRHIAPRQRLQDAS